MRILILIGTVLTLVRPAAASDVGATMAALQGEAASCRYLMELCRTSLRATASVKGSVHPKPGPTGYPGETPEEGNARIEMAVARMVAAPQVAAESIDDLATGMQVLRAKYGKPSCLAECDRLVHRTLHPADAIKPARQK